MHNFQQNTWLPRVKTINVDGQNYKFRINNAVSTLLEFESEKGKTVKELLHGSNSAQMFVMNKEICPFIHALNDSNLLNIHRIDNDLSIWFEPKNELLAQVGNSNFLNSLEKLPIIEVNNIAMQLAFEADPLYFGESCIAGYDEAGNREQICGAVFFNNHFYPSYPPRFHLKNELIAKFDGTNSQFEDSPVEGHCVFRPSCFNTESHLFEKHNERFSREFFDSGKTVSIHSSKSGRFINFDNKAEYCNFIAINNNRISYKMPKEEVKHISFEYEILHATNLVLPLANENRLSPKSLAPAV